MANGEGPPEGRTDPNSGLGTKVGPLSLGMWMLVGGGVLVFVWFMKSRSSVSSSGDVGSASSSGGASPYDPLLLSELLALMQKLAAENGANSVSPAPPAPTPNPPAPRGIPFGSGSYSGGVGFDPGAYQSPVRGTSHSFQSSGNGLSQVSASHIPNVSVPKFMARTREAMPTDRTYMTTVPITGWEGFKNYFLTVIPRILIIPTRSALAYKPSRSEEQTVNLGRAQRSGPIYQ